MRPQESSGVRLSCVGRQAILDRSLQVAGYELLYRDEAGATRANVVDDTSATATVLLNTIAEIGVEAVAGSHDMYVNCSSEVLMLPLPDLLSPRQVVLEVLETVAIEPPLIQRLTRLRESGFRIALDDYVLSDHREGLLPLADIVKVDILGTSPDDLRATRERLRDFSGLLLAEKVENQAEFELCTDLGFELFQGFFFCRPKVLSQKASATDRQRILFLLSQIQREDVGLDEALALVQRDVAVSYRLLRCLNSVVFGLRQPVESLRQALILLGMPRVRAWIALMALSSVHDRSPELIRMAMIRAMMCQTVATQVPGLSPDTMFTVGMFSLLDVLLGIGMDELLDQLPLGPTARGALLGEPSAEYEVLALVRAYEAGATPVAGAGLISAEALARIWLEAVEWVDEATDELLRPTT